MDRILLIASTFCFLVGFAYTMYAMGAKIYRASWYNFWAVALGFVLQTAFLAVRGHELKHCPLTNLFEAFVFLSWSMVLLYMLVGSAYRLSLMGAFTSPLVFFLQVFALLVLPDKAGRSNLPQNPWLEAHAALSMVAYGAFAVAAVVGAMYLVQERQLKSHQLGSIFFHFPSIANMAVALKRLIWVGFLILTAGLATGFKVGAPVSKVILGLAVWLAYGTLLLVERKGRLSSRRVAALAVATFGLTLLTLWGVNFISK